LSSANTLRLLDALRISALYRKDQNSYLLYPNKELPKFFEKNTIPEASVEKSLLLKKLVSDNNPDIIRKDVTGAYHFNGNFKNASDLRGALENMQSTEYKLLVESETDIVLQIFEEVFNHKAFTGRSGTFYAYEGLGSIYWHMVSKLHLAVQEACIKAITGNESPKTVKRLLAHYYEIGKGIGVHKSPDVYGAFPTDPYSHTPLHRGAQQPGMTGQVKEDILVRFGELGVFVNQGKLNFNPCLLRKDEFLKESRAFYYVNIQNEKKQLNIDKNTLGFTFCQIPVIYKLSDKNRVEVTFNSSSPLVFDSMEIDKRTSGQVFQRTGEVKQITVSLTNADLQEFSIF
jgi:putative ubiquitin-RnfH superfamily antitoxin RatB of RatAB toxin-antitoxin module